MEEDSILDPKDIYLRVLNVTASFVRQSKFILLDLDAWWCSKKYADIRHSHN